MRWYKLRQAVKSHSKLTSTQKRIFFIASTKDIAELFNISLIHEQLCVNEPAAIIYIKPRCSDYPGGYATIAPFCHNRRKSQFEGGLPWAYNWGIHPWAVPKILLTVRWKLHLFVVLYNPDNEDVIKIKIKKKWYCLKTATLLKLSSF